MLGRGVSPVVASVLLVAISLASALAFYSYLSSLQSQVQSSVSSRVSAQPVPVRIDSVLLEGNTLIVYVRSLGATPPDVNSAVIAVRTISGKTVAVVRPSSFSCEGLVCEINAPFNLSPGEYVITVTTGTGASASSLPTQLGLLSESSTSPTSSSTASPPYNPYSSWEYNKVITVSFAGTAPVSDYDLRIELNSDNFNFSLANPDGNDIRFAEYNAAANAYEPLSYWIQEWNSDANLAVVWVKLPQLLPGDQNIYMFYGNSTATSESNGSATFLFFDDFDGNSLNSTVWAVDSNIPAGGDFNYGVSNSILTMQIKGTGTAGSWAKGVIYLRNGVLGDLNGVPIRFVVRAFVPNTTANWYGRAHVAPITDINTELTGQGRPYALVYKIHVYTYTTYYEYRDSSNTAHDYAAFSKVGRYSVLRTDLYYDNNWIFMSYQDGNFQGSFQWPSYPFSDANHTIYFYVGSDLDTSYESLLIDWVALGKYASPPPTVTIH